MFSTVVLYCRIAAVTWCVVRSEASREALQAALDYACGTGADCGSLQLSRLSFVPNTFTHTPHMPLIDITCVSQ
ncbi:putative X8 domain-containing protein [Helianthus anomalus]